MAAARVFLRFLASGAFNTGATYLLYLALLPFLHYGVSYSLAYFFGIVLAYMLNRHFVFRHSGGRLGLFWVACIYLLQYALGLVLVSIWVQWLQAPRYLAPLFAVLLTLPVTFLLNRRVFQGPSDAPTSSPASR